MIKPERARPGTVNYNFIDRFTLVHFSIGVIYAFLGLSLVLTVILAVVWEFVENPLKVKLPRIFPHASADTFRNSAGDVLAVLIGWGTVYFFYSA